MNQHEKQLLFVDLSARLPYGVICKVQDRFTDKRYTLTDVHQGGFGFNNNGVFYGSDTFQVRPYLRTYEQLSEKEKWDYDKEFDRSVTGWVDWLNKHMVDYRGLIPMKLALKAPKDMYKFDEDEEVEQ